MLLSWIIVILTFVVIMLGFYILYIFVKKRFSRERYAFAALSASISLGIIAITSIIKSPWVAIYEIIAEILNLDKIEFLTPHWSEQILVLGFVSYIISLIGMVLYQSNNTKNQFIMRNNI